MSAQGRGDASRASVAVALGTRSMESRSPERAIPIRWFHRQSWPGPGAPPGIHRLFRPFRALVPIPSVTQGGAALCPGLVCRWPFGPCGFGVRIRVRIKPLHATWASIRTRWPV